MIPWFFGGNSAKGDLLTTKKKKKNVLRMVKRGLAPFWGTKSPYALFCIKESRKQLEDVAWGSRKGGWIPQTTQRMANRVNSMQGPDLCVVSMNEHVNVME